MSQKLNNKYTGIKEWLMYRLCRPYRKYSIYYYHHSIPYSDALELQLINIFINSLAINQTNLVIRQTMKPRENPGICALYIFQENRITKCLNSSSFSSSLFIQIAPMGQSQGIHIKGRERQLRN